MNPVIISPEAEADLTEAYRSYEELDFISDTKYFIL